MGVDWAVAELGWVALVEVDMDMRGEPGAGAGAGAGSCSEDCRRILGSWLLLVAGVTPPLPAAATLYFSDIVQIYLAEDSSSICPNVVCLFVCSLFVIKLKKAC